MILELPRAVLRSFPWPFNLRPARRPIPGYVRARVMQRDGHKCQACGRTDDLVLDHHWPWIHGGSDDPSNLVALCWDCNADKSGTPPLDGMIRRFLFWAPVCILVGFVGGLALSAWAYGPEVVADALRAEWLPAAAQAVGR